MTDSSVFPVDFPVDSIHLGDCVELLRKLPDDCAQLVIADPPYNLGPRFGLEKEWGYGHGRCGMKQGLWTLPDNWRKVRETL